MDTKIATTPIMQVEPIGMIAPTSEQATLNTDAPALVVYHRDGSTIGPVSSVVLRGTFFKSPTHPLLTLAGWCYLDNVSDGAPYIKLDGGGGLVGVRYHPVRPGWSHFEFCLDVSPLDNPDDFCVTIGFEGAVSSPLYKIMARNLVVFTSAAA